jgi:hypothetical protein
MISTARWSWRFLRLSCFAVLMTIGQIVGRRFFFNNSSASASVHAIADANSALLIALY